MQAWESESVHLVFRENLAKADAHLFLAMQGERDAALGAIMRLARCADFVTAESHPRQWLAMTQSYAHAYMLLSEAPGDALVQQATQRYHLMYEALDNLDVFSNIPHDHQDHINIGLELFEWAEARDPGALAAAAVYFERCSLEMWSAETEWTSWLYAHVLCAEAYALLQSTCGNAVACATGMARLVERYVR